MTLSLLKTHTLSFTEYGDATDKGYYNKAGTWVEPTGTSSTVAVQGSLQPFSKKNTRVILPEGTREQDTFVFFSKSEIRVIDQANNLKGAFVTIDGDVYEVSTRSKWQGYSLIPDHWEYLLIRKNPA